MNTICVKLGGQNVQRKISILMWTEQALYIYCERYKFLTKIILIRMPICIVRIWQNTGLYGCIRLLITKMRQKYSIRHSIRVPGNFFQFNQFNQLITLTNVRMMYTFTWMSSLLSPKLKKDDRKKYPRMN